MNTKQLTRGAMVCAIYGLFLFLNQQLGLMIENGMSWIFAFPILIYAAQNTISASMICALAMVLETFLFGGFSTWFYSWSSILIGLLYGIGIYKKWSNTNKLVVTFILSVISYIFIMWIWAGIFQIDYMEDFESIHTLFPFIDLKVFMSTLILLLSLLQTVCIHLLAIMVCIRLKIAIQPIRKVWQIKPLKWVGIVSILLWVLFYFSQNVIECSEEAKDILLLLSIIDLCLLDYYGIVYMMHYCVVHNQRKLAFFAVLGAFIPFVQIVWIVLGELDCLFSLRKIKN